MGDAFLGAFVQVVLQNLSTLIESSIRAPGELKAGLEKLKNSLARIMPVLGNAERIGATREEDKRWLSQLRDAAYEANDVVDEINIEAIRVASVSLPEVRNALAPVNPVRLKFLRRVLHEIRDINKRIDDLEHKRRDVPNPDGGEGTGWARHEHECRETDGHLSPGTLDSIRMHEVGDIVQHLVTDIFNVKQDRVMVTSIHGLGGIGKTTLARIVFNLREVSSHFDMMIWVYAASSANVTELTKRILEAVAGHCTDLSQLHMLQSELMGKLRVVKYLLVLDDLWSAELDCSSNWIKLCKPLLDGARGSRILVTTQSPTTAKITSTLGSPIVLEGLSDEHCRSVFIGRAFEDPDDTVGVDKLMVKYGDEIVKKCCGSPLAAVTLGSQLKHAKKEKWERYASTEMVCLSRSERSVDEMLRRSLGSAYNQFSSELRQCFRICGIFPDGFALEKDALIRLWMSQRFTPFAGRDAGESSARRPEDSFAEHLESLVDWLFFRRTHGGGGGGGGGGGSPSPKYVMEGLVPVLARFVSIEECCIFEHNRSSGKAAETVRHASLVCNHASASSVVSSNDDPVNVGLFEATRGLYTLLLVGDSGKCSSLQIPVEMGTHLSRLRALDLGGLEIETLDDSIAELIHLRYLNISSTKIRRLPDAICSLYNLQTLGLRNCTALEELPRNMGKHHLINLRHLDLHTDDDDGFSSLLGSMPEHIGELKHLQTLSRFVVGRGRRCAGIGELGKLSDIRGELRLRNLHNVLRGHEAGGARLSDKRYLTRIELHWSWSHDDYLQQQRVLDKLRAPSNLEELRIVGYGGFQFPRWLSDPSNFSRLVKISLSNFGRCETLPALGVLPSLEDLRIKGMYGVTRIDCSFCGGGFKQQSVIGFPKLRRLQFEDMPNWKEWSGAPACTLPSLLTLEIKNCPCLADLIGHSYPENAEVIISPSK